MPSVADSVTTNRGRCRVGPAVGLVSELEWKGSTMTLTINDIQDQMRRDGSHWWDPDTMRTFGTRVVSPVYQGAGGVYFVTRDKQWDGSRAFTVRQYDPDTFGISNVGQLGEHSDQKDAKTAARRAAAGNGKVKDVEQAKDVLRPISNESQLLSDLHAHGCGSASIQDALDLIRLAKLHHFQCERQCNGYKSADALRERAESHIETLCEVIGCAPVFSGDPRGCTVRLALPDGETNDFAKEGWIVPTEKGAPKSDIEFGEG